MSDSQQIVIGRSRDCGLVLSDGTVSGRHARLTWQGASLLVEDLGSANGTWVRGQRVTQLQIRPGEDLRLGAVSFPWGHPDMYAFLRRGAAGDTILGMSIPGRKYICGACGQTGLIPTGFDGGTLSCAACHTALIVGRRPVPAPPRQSSAGSILASLLMLGVAAGIGVWLWQHGGEERARVVREQLQPIGPRPTSAEELSVRVHTRDRVVASMDSSNPVVRNTAARIAADAQGNFSIEQVANIFSHVRGSWRYVNDPEGSEYFAHASETITNEYVGDCDDFAIVVAAMLTSIGGRARIVMMSGPEGGHAYPEVCLAGDPEDVRAHLDDHYQHLRDRALRQHVNGIHYRPAEDCPLWLNLDWNAGVPGGAYEAESWAVAIYPDGRTETLATAGTPPPAAPPAPASGG
ncbi:MAG: FHA domain-containing protein [Sandaracinaceae bacterium]|nr:FHA domain-containing protein [Myxococcales bacterium]MCB9658976.1 FHA domain-containing protein [Sandaracinaceae bacterium]